MRTVTSIPACAVLAALLTVAALVLVAAGRADPPSRHQVENTRLARAATKAAPQPPSRIERMAKVPPLPPMTPEERALFDLQERGRMQVEALMRQARLLPDGLARHHLLRRTGELKLQNRVEVLRTRAAFARQRGDFATAQECDAATEALLHPPRRPVPEPVLVKPAEGGAR